MDFKDLIISNQLLKLSQYFISMLSNSASKNSFLILRFYSVTENLRFQSLKKEKLWHDKEKAVPDSHVF